MVLYGSSTTIAATGVPGNYTLTATAGGFGVVPPHGTVTFNNTSANTVLGTSSLAPLPVGRDFGLSYSMSQDSLAWQAAGDFNGDGKVDVVTANTNYLGSISVFMGAGDGTLSQTPLTISVGQNPECVQVADVNHDGKLDILVTEYSSDDVGVLLGNGDGTFQAEITYPTGNTPQYFVVADLNGDGILDLVVNNRNDNNLSVLLGNGDGTFQPQTIVASGHSGGMTVGDFNNDGVPDLIVSVDDNVNAPAQSSISLFLGNGDGSFSANPLTIALPAGILPSIPSVADLRKSGKLDVVFGDDRSATVYVLLGNNDGTFAPLASYPTEDFAGSVSLADMNNDGILDLVAPNTGPDYSGKGVSILYGVGDGTFGAFTQYGLESGGGPAVAAVADFNGDGLMDIATANADSQSTAVLPQFLTTPATLTGASVPGPGANYVRAAYGGDTSHSSSYSHTVPLYPLPSTMVLTGSPNPSTSGTPLTLTANLSGTGAVPTGTVSFYTGSTLLGTGSINASGVATYSLSAGLAARTAFSAVYAGDGLYAGSTSSFLEYVGTPSSVALAVSAPTVTAGTLVTLTATVTPNPASPPVAAGQVVFNYQQTVNGSVRTGTFGPVAVNSFGVGATKFIAGGGTYTITANFSGTAGETPSASAVQTVVVAPNPLYSSVTTLTPTTVAPNNYSLLASVTAFGQAAPSGPVSFYSDVSTLLTTVALDPATLTDAMAAAPGSPLTIAAGTPTFVATGDLNGDGIPDLVTAVSGNIYSLAVQIGVGDGTFGTPSSLTLSNYPNSIAIADLNGDGVPDLIVAESTGVGVLLGTGSGNFASESFIDASAGNASFVVASDLNGDGILDLAVGGSSGPVVMIGVGDGTFHAPVAYAAAAGGAGLAVADLNGDGVPDLIAADAGNGSVSLFLGNSDGTYKQATTTYLAARSPIFVTTADLRHNGTKDVVVTDMQGANVYVMFGNNDGTLQNAVAYPLPSSGYHSGAAQVLAGDLNNDGVLDLAVAVYGSYGGGATISVLPGLGDGTFGTRIDYASGAGPYGIAIADFNTDGLLDITAADMSDSTSTIYLQQQTVTATATNVNLDGTGNHPVLASYAGDAIRNGSQSSGIVLTGLDQSATNTVLTFSPNPVSAGQTLNLLATVAPLPTGTSRGMISFYNGNSLLGIATVSTQGTATLAIMNVVAGTLTVHAVYSGDPTLLGSTSASVPITVTAAAQLALSAVPSNITAGGNLGTVSVGIEDVNGRVVTTSTAPVLLTITGPVAYSQTFSAAAVSGVATFPLSSTPITSVGSYTVSATSPGLSDATTTFTVSGHATLTTLTSSSLTPSVGTSILLTAVVVPSSTDTPPGSVAFYDGNQLLNTGPLSSAGSATLSVSLPFGPNGLTAVYSGSLEYAASTSPALSLVVAKIVPAVTWPTPAAISYGTPLSATQLNATALVAGTFTYNPGPATTLPAGTSTLSVTFTPSDTSRYTTATASVQIVVRATTLTALTSSKSTELASMPLTFNAQVSSAFIGAETGSVSFFDGVTLLSTVPVTTSGLAAYSTTSLSDGSHTITATYSGDTNYLSSTSSPTAAIVTIADVNLNLGGDQNQTVVPGAAVSYSFPLSPLVTPTFLYDVHLTATGLPPGATYTFTPALIPAGTGNIPVTLTVQTAKGTASLSVPTAPGSRNSSRGLTALAFGLFLPLLGAKSVRRRLKDMPRPLAMLLFALLSFTAATGLGGCGGGGFFGATKTSGTYTIKVTATSGSLVRSSTVQLTIQ